VTTVTAVTAFRSAEAVCKTSSRSSRLSRGAAKFRRGAGSPFQRAALASQRAQNLLVGCIFDGSAVKSAFALLLARVTEPELEII